MQGGENMGNIYEEAKNYVGKETKNIADLDIVSVDLEIQEREGSDKDGKPFSYKVALIGEEEYRVPFTVLKQLKAQIEANPGLKEFSVSKYGEGMNTEYTVIPKL